MGLIVQIIFGGFLIIGSLIALKKDFAKLTDEQKKQPIVLIFDFFLVLGYLLLVIGFMIFDILLLGDIAVILFTIGIAYKIVTCWKANSVIGNVRKYGLALLFVVFYIFFYR
ncbi:hypothetical protein [Sporosarcina sp. NPDC096371]|uniref:hypothetical protein n=1 Tax=Sporosarcina sp. NPDC096371 TaxID=3364530 RepID=UPI0037FE5A18